MSPKEDVRCYASSLQRELFTRLIDYPLINQRFFLTGGTALSVFYLHHRSSDDLDFFTVDQTELSEVSRWISVVWQSDRAVIRSSPQFLSLLITGVRVEFVIDPLSEHSERPRVILDNKSMAIDTLRNIAVNKLCTLVNRTEPKDFIDFYFLSQRFRSLALSDLLLEARRREALFDDPPTAGYQLEEGTRFVRDHPQLLPPLKTAVDREAMFSFYEDLARTIFSLKPGRQ